MQDQYVFIHDAILESVTCGDTEIHSANLRRMLIKMSKISPDNPVTMLETQFKVQTEDTQCMYVLTHLP